jgi:formylglycine-generating enzyme required for sulfatase activity
MRHRVALIVLVCVTLFFSRPALAQFSQQGPKLVGTGAVGAAQQGVSVSLSADGNTAIVGGPADNANPNGWAGAAWVWTRSGGVWTQQGTKLVGSDASEQWPAEQGYSVSLSADGNTAIVGGPAPGWGGVGAAWVWTRGGGVWAQQGTKLVGSGAVGLTAQGFSVSLSADGNTAVGGGYFDNYTTGATWVWTRSGGVWTQQGNKLVGSDAVGTAAQGYSVSLSADGNTAITGGVSDNSNVGAAWIWTRSGGVWTQQGTKLVGSSAVGSRVRQGTSVSLSADGNTAIVGGPEDNAGAGAAWVWMRSGGIWTQQGAKLVGSGAVGPAAQGASVSLSADGNMAIVGGTGDSNAGAAWVWTRSGGVWTQQGTKLVGSGAVGSAYQGTYVSLSADGNTAIVGGNGDNSSAGAAWVFAAPGTGGQEVTVTLAGGIPLTIVRIPAGTFQMGSPDSERGRFSGEGPLHQVTLTSDYYMGKYLVTQGQWQAVMGTAMSTACGSVGIGASYPVYCVSWNDIRGTGGFIEKLNTYLTSTGQAGAGKFRLPTEAEWERAARGGTQTRFSFGDALDCDDGFGACSSADPYVWWYGNSGSTSHPVGTKQANPYGLFDMHGNLEEWCEDWYGAYGSSAQTNPTGPTTGSVRVGRGGGWGYRLDYARSAIRGGYYPDDRDVSIGFRLSRSLDASDGGPSTLTAALRANPASGTAPLTTTLTATAGGTASGTVNYTFWWNCADAGTSVSTVTAACGDPTNATFGANFDSVNGATQAASTTYAAPGTYSAKVIIERGSAPPAEQRTSITATSPVPPAPAVSAVSPSSGPMAGGTDVTITGTNFAASATVTIGGTAATVFSVTATTINATTPAHVAGAANVVVHNPDGQTGTLTGGFTFSDTPPVETPPVRGDLPEDSGSWPTPASKAVVITHGWKDGATPTLDPLILLPWVEEMAGKVCGKLGAGLTLPSGKDGYLTKRCQANNWDVWILDWRSKAATFYPWDAWVNAIDRGENLALNLKGKDYQHIHFIAHSAGAELIDFSTFWLRYWVTKESRPALEIHATFLDAYDPNDPNENPSLYGKQADWTDNYVDTRDVGPLFGAFDGTRLFLQYGYNVDVTPTSDPDPCMQFSWPLDVYGCRHNRPYRFYGLSVDSSFVGNAASAAYDPIPTGATGGMGYPLSLENGHSLSTLNNIYPKGAKCVMSGGICYAGSLPPSVWTFLPGAIRETVVDGVAGAVNYVAGVGATVFNSLKTGVLSLLPTSSTAVHKRPSATPTEAPSWIAVKVTTTQPINTLRFNWRFDAAGEGFLRVFVDGSLVREIDQRHVSLASLTTEEIYIGGGTGTLAPGIHRIAFRLDGFGTSASGMELTGVELGLTAANVATSFYTLAPCRFFDTRNTTGPDWASPALAPGETRTFAIGGRCSLPASARSLSVNQTVTGQTASGELVLYRGDLSATPTASSISFPAGKTRANNGILDLARDGSGTFKVFNNSTGSVHFILDANGYFQ